MHVYKSSIDNRPLPSVTYIIDKTKPLAEVIKFAKIKAKKIQDEGETEEGWAKRCSDGRNRGTLVHAYAESYLPHLHQKALEVKDGCPIEDYKDSQMDSIRAYWESRTELGVGDYVKQFNAFFDALTIQTKGDWEVLGLEETILNETLGYGGRSDLRLRIGNNYSLIDFKTTKPYINWDGTEIHQWSDWALWRKAKQLPVYTEKVMTNGDIKQVRKRNENGGYAFEKEVRPSNPDWSWVGSYPYNYYLQQCLYILGYRDMKEHQLTDATVQTSNLLVLFPKGYQLVSLPASVWQGCKLEATERVKLFYKEHYQKWLLEIAYDMPDNETVRDKDREPKGFLPPSIPLSIDGQLNDSQLDELPF